MKLHRFVLVVAGIALKRGKFDGIYLARRENSELVYAGKVEHGFDTPAKLTCGGGLTSLKRRSSRSLRRLKNRKPYGLRLSFLWTSSTGH